MNGNRMKRVCALCLWEIEDWQRAEHREGSSVHANPADHLRTREPQPEPVVPVEPLISNVVPAPDAVVPETLPEPVAAPEQPKFIIPPTRERRWRDLLKL